VNVVRNASHKHRLATPGVDELSDVAVETSPMFFFNGRTSGFDVKDDVKVNFTE